MSFFVSVAVHDKKNLLVLGKADMIDQTCGNAPSQGGQPPIKRLTDRQAPCMNTLHTVMYCTARICPLWRNFKPYGHKEAAF